MIQTFCFTFFEDGGLDDASKLFVIGRVTRIGSVTELDAEVDDSASSGNGGLYFSNFSF